MPQTYEPIATTTLGSTTSTITFSSIPATYTDLRLVLTTTTDNPGNPRLIYNSDGSTNYSRTTLTGNGSTASSSRATSESFIFLYDFSSTSTSVPTFTTLDIFNYAGSTNKTSLSTTSADLNGSGTVERIVGLWRSTSAINRIDLTCSFASYAAGTTATLYGILKA